MYLTEETHKLLSDRALLLAGDGAAFRIYYWGIESHLFDNPVHKHSFFEVCYVMDGEGEYMDNGIHYPLKQGTHFCSRPGVTHQIRTRNGLFLLFVAFELDEAASKETFIESFRTLADNGEACVFDGGELPTALLWRTLLLRENKKGNIPSHAIPSVAHALLLSFLSLFGKDEPIPTTRRDAAIILRQAKLFIRDNLSQPLTLNGIAQYLNVSERHLSRMFSTGIGENFTNYVRDERIRKAASLLTLSELPIKEISEATGFSSVHYFTRVFTQMKELPPGQYRNKYQLSP